MSRGEPHDLRRRAEARVATRAGGADPEALRLLHELEVHQVELELQNEELRAARHEIEAGLRRYTELFDFAPTGYLVCDGAGVIQAANFAAARLLGTERARLTGRRVASCVDPRGAADFLAFLARAVASDDPSAEALELHLARTPGAATVRVTAAMVGDSPASLLLSMEDVTARRRAEEALRDELRRRDDFLAALSHELRNPLAPIRSGLALLDRAPDGSEQARRARAVLDRQVSHLTRMVDGLLDVARLARGKVDLRRERAEAGELVQRTVEDHRAAFEATGIELDARLPGEPCWVDVDATRVAQVLGNLLANAAKFSTRGGRVEVTVRRDGAAVAIGVGDTGIGIAPEVRARLFQPFAQGPQPLDRTRGGLGLGLATVKGIVELLGGTVALHSEGPGRGAVVTVRLPLVDPPGAPAREAAPPRRGGLRVLVVDDNADGASTLEEVLALSGHDVRVALDGPSGVAAARAFRPDVVLCDIGLPGMDGYAVARTLRGDPATRGAYLVALSGYAQPEDVRRAREAGFDRHLAKPPVFDALERILDERRGAAR